MCTTTGARFQLNFHIFYVNVDSDPEAEFALENLNIISMSSCTSVHGLLEEFHIFYVKGASDVHARFALEIWTLFLRMAVFMAAWRFDGFFRPFWPFFALLRVLPELSAIFRSPRWRRVLCHRGLLHNFILRACRHRHPS